MNYRNRRNKLYDSLGNVGKLLLFSGFEINRSADDNYPFSVNRNFFYLTGIDQHDSYLVVDLASRKETLYILDNDEKLSRWIGYFYTHEEAKNISQIEDIQSSNDLTFLKECFKDSNLFLDLEKVKEKGGINYGEYFKNLALEENKNIKFIDVYPSIITLRSYKDEDEITEIKHAISVTNFALQAVMKKLKGFKNEQEAHALFEERIFAYAHATPAFTTICGSGKNGTTLHYHMNNEVIEKDSLILMDLGARTSFYNADITRTYPTSGKFTPLERTIYQIVLDCNKEIINRARPGVSLQVLQEFTVDFLAKRCLEKGLIDNYEEIHDVYFHRISHHLGLDVHDPMPRDSILEVGNVISDEPGLYFSKFGIGVRIEDDLLITENGCVNLSQEIIKEIDDIEKFMNE